MKKTDLSSRAIGWWLFAAFFFITSILFIGLGNDGLYAAQEGRTAIIVRNMLVSGNLLNMDFAYGIPYEKPIGHYWLCLPFAWMFHLHGNPLEVAAEFALRLPSVLSALLSIGLAAALAKRIFNWRTAIITLFMLGSMSLFDKLGRLAHIDMPLCAAYTLAMYFLYIGFLENRRSNQWIYGFYAALGWGLILKGPLVLILAALVVLGMMFKTRNWRMLGQMRPFTGLLVLLGVGVPWYVVESLRTDGAFFQEFIVNQNIRRFTGVGSTYRNGEYMPVWYYLPKLFTGLLPWSVFLLPGVYWFRHKFRTWRFSDGAAFLLLWLGTGFVFFSLSALKRGDYLLLLYPAAGIVLARILDETCNRLPALHKGWKIGWWILAVLLVTLFLVNNSGVLHTLGQMIIDDQVPFGAKRDGMSLIMISDFFNDHLLVTAALGAVMLLALFLLGKFLEKGETLKAFGVMAAVVWSCFFTYHGIVEPATDCYKTVKPLAREVQKIIPPGQEISYSGIFNTELVYFVNRPYTVGDYDAPFLLAEEDAAEELLKKHASRWHVKAQTLPDHQYPVYFLEKQTP